MSCVVLSLLPMVAMAQAQVLAIKAGTLVMPESGQVLQNQVVVVENGRIRSVGVEVPAGAQVIDLSGYSVLPGLFDCHTHLCMNVQLRRDGGNYFYTTLRDSAARRAVQGVANARDMLNAGFTTCRDVGNEGNYACSELRWAIERGMVPGPTIINAGRIIAPYGGQFQLQQDERDLAEPEYFFADTRDEMIKGIRENVHYGARVIKIVVDDQRYIYTADDIRFMVEEAGRMGVKLAAHCWTQAGARNAIAAGVASIEHGTEMDDETLRMAKDKGVVLVGTEFPVVATIALGSSRERAERDNARWVDRLRRAYKIGVPMAFGSDATAAPAQGSDRGKDTIEWLQSWVDAGVPAPHILQCMTTNAAKLLGVDDQRGAIKAGQWADIIAVQGNPLEDINSLRSVRFVMKNGKVIRNEAPPPGN